MNFRGNCLRALAFASYLILTATYPVAALVFPFTYGGYGTSNGASPYGVPSRVYGGGYGPHTPTRA